MAVGFRTLGAVEHDASEEGGRSDTGCFHTVPVEGDNSLPGIRIGVAEHYFPMMEPHLEVPPSRSASRMVEEPMTFHHPGGLQRDPTWAEEDGPLNRYLRIPHGLVP